MTIIQRIKKIFDPIDLTKGEIKRVFTAFLIPIVLSMLLQQIYSLTDSIIVGKTLSENEIAGVNDSIPIAYLLLDFTIGCTSGFSVILANAIGKKDERAAKKSIFVQLYLTLILDVIMTACAYFLIDPLLSWLNIVPSETNQQMQEIYLSAHSYLTILFLFGFTAQFFYNLIVSILRSIGDSFTPFLILLFSTILNIGLDFLFILVFSLGVKGSAYATALSQAISAVAAIIYAIKRYSLFRLHKEDVTFKSSDILSHLKQGLPLGFQYSILYIGVVIMTSSVIPFDVIDSLNMVSGNPAQVGYGVANKLSGFLMLFFSAIGTALLSFISQNRGAGEEKRIKDGFKFAMIITIGICLFDMLVGYLLTINGAYQHIFLSADKVNSTSIHYGNTYLYVSLPFYFFLSLIFIGRGVLQAYEKPLFPLLGGIVELITRALVCLLLPQFINGGPINSQASLQSFIAVCFADPLTWIASALVVIIPSFICIYKKRQAKNS